MQGKEILPHDMPVFFPDNVLKSLFHNYRDNAERIFKLNKTNDFWKSIRDDDPKLLSLMKELPCATYFSITTISLLKLNRSYWE